MQLDASLLLQVAEHAEQVARLRIAARVELGDSCGGVCEAARFCGWDQPRLARDREAGLEIAEAGRPFSSPRSATRGHQLRREPSRIPASLHTP
jgi:hypothetical protein